MTIFKVGILHSLHGTMATSELPLVDAAIMAIDEINQQGGVCGHRIEPVIEDGTSDPLEFEQRIRKLIIEDQIDTIFGCWTSASRKAVKPLVESSGSLLWYPVQYEGLEESPNIVYTGNCLNQQIEPAVKWILQQGKLRCLLIGSDYVFPRVANPLIQSMITRGGGTVVADHYVPLGWQDFSSIIEEIGILRPDVIFNTLNGGSNFAFFRQFYKAGLRANEVPVMSFSIAETEQQMLAQNGAGHYVCRGYFQTYDTEKNRKFIHHYQNRYNYDGFISDPIVTAYSQLWLWRNTVEATGSFKPNLVRKNLVGQQYESPAGIFEIQPNHHLNRFAAIGCARENGLYDIVWQSDHAIKPKPWLGVEDLLLAAKPLIKNALSFYPQSVHYANMLETTTVQRKQIFEHYHINEKHFHNLISASPVGIYLTDAAGKCTYVNNCWREMTGLTLEEALGDGWTQALHPDDKQHVVETWNSHVKSGDRWSSEYRFINKKDETIWILGIATPLRDETGKIIEYLGFNTEISRRKQAEAELTQYQNDLEKLVRERTTELLKAKNQAEVANRAKSTFLANMSHEFRTPLNAILGFSQLMQVDPEIPEAKKESLRIIYDSSQRLLALINSVIDMSRLEIGRFELQSVSFDIFDLLHDIVDKMQHPFETKGLQLLLALPSTSPCYIHTDAKKIRQILTNLLNNALKYTKQGTVKLSLDIEEANDKTQLKLIFEIVDSGIGIAPDDQLRIFEPFVQIGESNDLSGTGLGLTITQQYAELMGGVVQLESNEGKGSIFRVILPSQKADKESAITINSCSKNQGHVLKLEPGQAEWRILVVEDSIDNRLLLKKILETAGFIVREATNGQEAIEIFEKWQPHLVWMDIRMPVMGGLEAMRRLRATEGANTTVIVALTASVHREQQQEILSAGADDFICKPFQVHEIFDCMARHLDVRYVYEEEKKTVPQTQLDIDLESLGNLSDELLSELKEAISLLDVDYVLEVITRIEKTNPTLAHALRQRIDALDFNNLNELMKQSEA